MSRGRRRKWNTKRISVILGVVVVIILGTVIFSKVSRTSYQKVNRSMGEYMVKANEEILAKDTGKQLKNALYVPRKIDKSKKIIAFTFDDGPKRGNTERVINALERNDARATFFMLGQNAKLYPESVKKVLESGNEVSGHSYNHPQLTKIGAAGVRKQMKMMNQALKAACGSKAVSVRPPYGAIDQTVKNNVDGPLILWNIDTLDWKTRNTNATVQAILKNAKDGDIVLMHDIHLQTVEAVEKVLPKLKERGFEVCTVSELLEAKGVKASKGNVVISANQIR